MKVSITPECLHPRSPEQPEGWFSAGEPITGHRLLVTRDGVWVDGRPAILRDRRPAAEREPGHRWVTSNNHPDPRFRRIGWTRFTVDVEP